MTCSPSLRVFFSFWKTSFKGNAASFNRVAWTTNQFDSQTNLLVGFVVQLWAMKQHKPYFSSSGSFDRKSILYLENIHTFWKWYILKLIHLSWNGLYRFGAERFKIHSNVTFHGFEEVSTETVRCIKLRDNLFPPGTLIPPGNDPLILTTIHVFIVCLQCRYKKRKQYYCWWEIFYFLSKNCCP